MERGGVNKQQARIEWQTNLVERKSETAINVHTMEDCQPQHTTHKVEIRQVFLQQVQYLAGVRVASNTHWVDGGIWVNL